MLHFSITPPVNESSFSIMRKMRKFDSEIFFKRKI